MALSPIAGDQVRLYVDEQPLVQQSVCAVADDAIVVGILSEPIFSRSEREAFVQTLAQSVRERFGKPVYVTLDTDLYYRISKCGDADAENIRAIAKLIAQRSANGYARSDRT